MDDPPPPTYKPEWDPYHQPTEKAEPLEEKKQDLGFHPLPSAPGENEYPPPPAYPPGGAGALPSAPGYLPSTGPGNPPAGPGSPPTAGQGYPPPGGSGYPPPSGPGYPPPPGGPAYPPPAGSSYPPPEGATPYPPPLGPVSQDFIGFITGTLASQRLPHSIADTTVTVVDRDQYTGPVLIAPGKFDPKDEEGSEGCSCFWIFFSLLWHGGFFVWMGLLIWQVIEKSKHDDGFPNQFNNGLFIASAVLMGCSYLFMLIESCCSNTQEYLNNKMTLDEAEVKVAEVRKGKVKLKWYAECYHYETERYKDSEGNTKTRQKKVTTKSASEYFYCDEVVDASNRFRSLKFGDNSSVLRVTFFESFGFADEYTQALYQNARSTFYNRYKNFDTHFDFSETLVVSVEHPQHITVFARGDEDQMLMSRGVFWCFTLFMCSFVYRAWFRYKTGRATYTYLKLMRIRGPGAYTQ